MIEGPDPQTTMKVSWNKPDGGDAIDTYDLEWIPILNTRPIESLSVKHQNGRAEYSQHQSDLTPGEIYDVKISAKNKVGWNSTSQFFAIGKRVEVYFSY